MQLIRMVSHQCPGDGSELLQATPTNALELRPYIEEPVSKDAMSLNFRPLDFRPRIRHDFVLSNRKAVDEYWETLEYCYATADPRAALHAFPGSSVHEVCAAVYYNISLYFILFYFSFYPTKGFSSPPLCYLTVFCYSFPLAVHFPVVGLCSSYDS